eukprot:SAG31_NODE_561_length_14087_cov_5.151405_3_plen_114_part_00
MLSTAACRGAVHYWPQSSFHHWPPGEQVTRWSTIDRQAEDPSHLNLPREETPGLEAVVGLLEGGAWGRGGGVAALRGRWGVASLGGLRLSAAGGGLRSNLEAASAPAGAAETD